MLLINSGCPVLVARCQLVVNKHNDSRKNTGLYFNEFLYCHNW